MTDGVDLLAPPTLLDYLAPVPLTYPVLPVIGIVSAIAYLAGAIRLWATGRKWSVARTISFLFGCLAIVAVMGLGVELYGYALFSVFMFQQLTLMMAIPPLLVLGSPGTLLLRATPRRGLGLLLLRAAHAGLRSPVARWLLSPVVAIPLYLLLFYGLYLTDLANWVLGLPGGHIGLEILFLASGVLFTIPLLSSDPLPVRMGYGGRAIDLFVEVALHAFFGIFIMMSVTLVVDRFAAPTMALGIDPLSDQQIAGGLAWSYGEGPSLLMLLYIMHRWFRDDTRKAAAADRRADTHGNDELDAYNAYLEQLRRRNQPEP